MDVPTVVPISESEFVVHQDGEQHPVRVVGHRLYVRKRKRKDEFDGGIIVRPDYMKNDTVICDVLAVGPRVGEWRDNPPKDVDGNPLPNRIPKIKLGSTLAFPEFHPDKGVICRSPYCQYDFFVDSALAVLEVDDGTASAA